MINRLHRAFSAGWNNRPEPGEAKSVVEAGVIKEPADKMYDLAIAQFTGFRQAQYDNSIISLATSMGLKKEEWNRLKKTGDIDFLKQEDKKEIDEYFKQR